MKHVYTSDENVKKGDPRAYASDTCGTLCKSPQKPRGPHTTQKMDRIKIQLDVEKSKSKIEKQIATHAKGKTREKKFN